MTRRFGPGDVEVVFDARAQVGEGPVWDVRRGHLVWVDIPGGVVHRLDPDGMQVGSVDVGQAVGAVGLRRGGGLVLALRDGFAVLESEATQPQMVCEVEADDSHNRMNDGKCDRAGRFWAGTMAWDMTPRAGALYRLDADHRASRVLTDVSVSNGLGWSADDSTMYFIDSGAHGIDAFDFDADRGAIANRRRLIDIEPQEGLADGMTVDAEDFLWVAVWDGWSVRRYSPGGHLDCVVELPVSQVTSCTFGGADLDELYITSASAGLSAEQRRQQPHAGAVFRVRPGVYGQPAQAFSG